MPRPTSHGSRPPRRRKPTTASRVRVIYEDRHILVADKPARLLTASTPRETRRTLLVHLLERERRRGSRSRLYAVHRLDRDASGLVLFARTEPLRARLRGYLEAHPRARNYRAVVEGTYSTDEEVLRSHLAQNAALKMYVTREPEKGQLAVSRIRVVERLVGATLIEATQETRVKHQLRAQLAAAGHPVVGDRRYGEDRPGAVGRLALHAGLIELEHPVSGEPLRLLSPCPTAFRAAFQPNRRRTEGP